MIARIRPKKSCCLVMRGPNSELEAFHLDGVDFADFVRHLLADVAAELGIPIADVPPDVDKPPPAIP